MSRPHFHYNVLRKTIIQFCDVFNDIVIARYDGTGTVQKYVKVPLKFAPKSKQWYWEEFQGERVDPVFPVMAVELENVEFAADRQVNRNFQVKASNDSGGVERYYNPVPYDFTFRVMVAAEYMVDITQVVEQIYPFFTPEAYIRLTIPELNISGGGAEDEAGADPLEFRVLYEGSTKEAPVELDEANYRVLRWDLTFRVQGYLFSPVGTSKPIHSVVTNWYLSDEAFNNSTDDVDLPIGTLGNQTVQGHGYATYIPKVDRVSTISLTTAGTTYDTATGVAVTGGAGTGCTVDITAASGPVTDVIINTQGEGYAVDDVLTISGGTGDATITVTELDNEPVDDTIREMFAYEHYEV